MFNSRFLSSHKRIITNSLRFGSVFLVALILSTLTGCGPRLSDEELGRIQKNVTDAPGAQELYQLPDLTAETVETDSQEGETEAKDAAKD